MCMDIQDTLNNISQLQTTEKQLYNSLTRNAENVALGKPNTYTDEEIKDISDQINSLSSSRVTLYNSLSLLFQSQQKTEVTAQGSLDQQAKTLQLLEKELNKSKKNLSKLKDEKYNQLRMIEINTYYAKQYDAHKRLMQMSTILGACILLSIGLEYTPLKIISKPLVVLCCVVGIVIIFRRVMNMSLRSDSDYDVYTWPGAMVPGDDINSANSSVISASTTLIPPILCASSSCCADGTIWNDSQGCVPTSVLTS